MREPTEEEAERYDWLSGLQGVRLGLYEVTDTQFAKGLVDANETIRESFAATGFHDFEGQPPGNDAKRVVRVWVLTSKGLQGGKMSLYRPETKGGVFYRFWVYRFSRHLPNARSGDLVALVQNGSVCVVVDLSLVELTQDRMLVLEGIFGNAAGAYS